MFSVCSIEECALRIYTRQSGEAGLTPARLFYLLGAGKMKSVIRNIKYDVWIEVDNQVHNHCDYLLCKLSHSVWHQLLDWEKTVSTCVEINIQNSLMDHIRQ